jgi:hypothetical protein
MGTSSPTETEAKAIEFIKIRDHYYKNAEEMTVKGEFRKASEMLWGAVTQTIKAIAALRKVEISNHTQFFTVVKEMSKELNDPTFYKTFVELNTLHRNFYDEFIPAEAFPLFFGKTKDYLLKLQSVIDKLVKDNRTTGGDHPQSPGC